MSPTGAVQTILETGKSYRLDEPPPWSQVEISEIERSIGGPLPRDYVEFLELNGLAELAFDQQLLSPAEIQNELGRVPEGLVPFASDGCGNHFCWQTAELPESQVLFLDHESGVAEAYRDSFIQCLREWRRP